MPPLCPCSIRIPCFTCTHVQSVHHIVCPNTQTVPQLYSPCLVCMSSLQQMARQCHTVFSPCPVINICTAHVLRLCHLYSTTPDRTTEPPEPLFATPLLPMSSHYIIATKHIQSEHHISNLMPTSSQYTICPVHVQSVNHLFCPSPLRTLPLLTMSSQ